MTVAETSRPTGFGQAYGQLRRAQKSARGAPAYSLYVNRPLGRVFAAAAFQVGLTPNQVTAVSAVFTFAGIGVLAVAPPLWWVGVLVSLALVLGYALDSADGQLARLRGGGSLVGEWLDHMIDAAKNCALHLAVAVAAYRFFPLPSRAWLLVPLGFTVVTVVHFFGMLLTELLGRVHAARHGLPTAPREGATPLRTLLKVPTDYGVLCLVFALLGAPLVFGVLYTLLAAGTGGYLLLVVVKWFRDVRALDRAAARGAR